MSRVSHQINTVRRTVGSTVFEAQQARVVTVSQTYDTTAEDLWDACTDVDRIPRWFLPISGDLRVGGQYQFDGNAGGTVLACDPPNTFTATWECNGQVSWIEVTVAADGPRRATFTLEHIVPIDAHWDEFGPGAVGIGWDSGLLGLAGHLGGLEAIDPSEGAAWMASSEGRDFISQTSESWYAADIAGGEEETTARARADRARAAYLGA